jgi:glycosyl-4,4'-diaponeurosporenoate acyltransferase
LYKQRKWEKAGNIYKTVFKIKSWKQLLPDGAIIFKRGFQKSRLTNSTLLYLSIFMQETCRAELTHWLVLLFAPLFFLWNYLFVGIIMILYALIVNIPCILTQRFNRIRLNKFVKQQNMV